MSKLEKGQNITKTVEETAMRLDEKMSMDAKLIVKLITQQVEVEMTKKTKQYEKKIKNLIWAQKSECWEIHPQKMVQGTVDTLPRK